MDDSAELRVIYEKFAVALTSLVQFVRQQLNQFGVPSIVNFNVVSISIYLQPTTAALKPLDRGHHQVNGLFVIKVANL